MEDDKSYKFRYILFLSSLNVFPALTTDMYLPALPSLRILFDTTLALMNLTLVLFFVSYSVSMLLWGPLSDRYGRKPILLTAMGIYVISSIACSTSTGIHQLILFRVFQGIGAGAAVAISIAITKDLFKAKTREKIIASIAMIMMVGPIIAPIIGAWLLQVTSWRGQFLTLAIYGIVVLVFVVFMKETNQNRTSSGIVGTLGKLGKVMKIKSLASGVLLFSFLGSPLWLFIGLSSQIFVGQFGLSEQQYSFYFAANGAFSILTIGLYLFLSKYVSRFKIITSGFIAVAISGIFTITIGSTGPLFFLVTALLATVSVALLRTPSMNLLLEQTEHDSGSASSLISSSYTIIGSVIMALASMGWGNLIIVFGIVNLTVGIACSIFWRMLVKRSVLIDNLNDDSCTQSQIEQLDPNKLGRQCK